MEIECDFDWEKLAGILDEAPVENEYIEYKGIKYIKEEYCIPKSKIKEKIEELEKEKDETYTKFLGSNRNNESLSTKGKMLEGGIQVLQELYGG